MLVLFLSVNSRSSKRRLATCILLYGFYLASVHQKMLSHRGGNELRPFTNQMRVRDICTLYHPPLDKPKFMSSQFTGTAKPNFLVVGKKEEKEEGMSLYDTVLVGDLSKFGINYVDIECKLEDDLEEMKSVVKETTKKAVCAFELLMSNGRSFPKKRKSSAGQKEGVLNFKDRLYNDIVNYLTESKLDFTKSVAETQGAYFVQIICNALWYITSHQMTIDETAWRQKNVQTVPDPFDKYTGYNDFKRKKTKCDPLSSKNLDFHANALYSLLSKPYINSSDSWCIDHIKQLAKFKV